MERLGDNKPSGIQSGTLRIWGFVFLVLGIIGKGLLQNRFLNLGEVTGQELLEIMSSSGSAMAIATAALVLQAIETCAVPLFAFLLVEGFTHTASRKKYFLRVAVLAAVSEIPYNLAICGKLLDMDSRNPVFGLALCLILMYFWNRFDRKDYPGRLLRFFITVAAVFWAGMLKIDQGIPMIVIVGVLWMLRSKPQMRTLVGSVASMACSAVSPFYLASAMGFLPIHMYNGEREESENRLYYITYPVFLMAGWAAGMLLF